MARETILRRSEGPGKVTAHTDIKTFYLYWFSSVSSMAVTDHELQLQFFPNKTMEFQPRSQFYLKTFLLLCPARVQRETCDETALKERPFRSVNLNIKKKGFQLSATDILIRQTQT